MSSSNSTALAPEIIHDDSDDNEEEKENEFTPVLLSRQHTEDESRLDENEPDNDNEATLDIENSTKRKSPKRKLPQEREQAPQSSSKPTVQSVIISLNGKKAVERAGGVLGEQAEVASLVVLAINLLAPAVYAQGEFVDGLLISGAAKGNRGPLTALAVGPYPRTALENLSPIVSDGTLEKRAYYCDPGYSLCPNNKCCRTGTLCAPTGGCCPRTLPWDCGGDYCCAHNSCMADGHCGCPVSYPVRCSDDFCCPSGTTCAPGNRCQMGGGGGGVGPDPEPTRTTAPATSSTPTRRPTNAPNPPPNDNEPIDPPSDDPPSGGSILPNGGSAKGASGSVIAVIGIVAALLIL
ncbi:hypothetical protein BGX27_006326 [Mortierella sp. AM989]|nr:hypothetical protein BGX27_006326 [Mortierella sp. AM989]